VSVNIAVPERPSSPEKDSVRGLTGSDVNVHTLASSDLTVTADEEVGRITAPMRASENMEEVQC